MTGSRDMIAALRWRPEQEFDAVEAPLFGRVERELEAAREQARAAELKTGEAVQEARTWARVKNKAEKEKEEARNMMQQAHVELDRSERLAGHAVELKQQLEHTAPVVASAGTIGSPRSPLPGGRRGLLQRADRLARQAADLEEEAKRKEAQAFYLVKESDQLEALCTRKLEQVHELEQEAAQRRQAADELEAAVAAELDKAEQEYKEAEAKQRDAQELENRVEQLRVEARAVAERADIRAERAELHLRDAVVAAQLAEAAKSALVQAQRDADLLYQRAEQLLMDAEAPARGAEALMQRAYEKAVESYGTKKAAQQAPDEDAVVASNAPSTPELPPQLASELDRTQKGLAASELHASQLVELAHRREEHAHKLEHTAERHAVHVQRVLADAAYAHAQEEEALERAQRRGEAASRRAGQVMAEQWAALAGMPEWRQLTQRYPETIQQLSAAAAGNGVHPAAAAATAGGGGGGADGDQRQE